MSYEETIQDKIRKAQLQLGKDFGDEEMMDEAVFKAGMQTVVDNLPKGLFVSDSPPQEGKPYSHLGCYILRWGKDKEPTLGLCRLSDDEDWQSQLIKWDLIKKAK